MDARARTVSEILHEPGHYIVPLFQRSYSWHKEHWQRLTELAEEITEDYLVHKWKQDVECSFLTADSR